MACAQQLRASGYPDCDHRNVFRNPVYAELAATCLQRSLEESVDLPAKLRKTLDRLVDGLKAS